MKHRPVTYACITGTGLILYGWRCGPCRIYSRKYRTRRERNLAMSHHCQSPVSISSRPC